MKTPKFGKIFALLIAASAALIATAHPQAARTVMVNSNSGVLLFPTNLWSANAANARSGLSLGSAATNPSSAFQPSSTILSNLASSNGAGLTNLTATNVTGAISISNGGTGATNAAAARTNLGLGATNSVAFSSAVFGDGISLNYNEIGWEGGVLFDLETEQINGTWNFVSAVSFGDVATTRTNLGLGTSDTVRFGAIWLQQDGEASNNISHWSDGIQFRTAGFTYFETDLSGSGAVNFYKPLYFPTNTNSASITRTNLGLGSTWLTNTNVASFRSDIGLGSAATNLASAFQPSSAVLSNLANNNGASLTNISVSNLGTISVVNGGTGATNAATARTNLGLGATNSVTFNILTATSSVSTPDLSGDNITVEGAIYFTEALTNVGVTRTNLGLAPFTAGDGYAELRDATNGLVLQVEDGVMLYREIAFGSADAPSNSRVNLGLGWSALTNSNAGTGLVSVNTNGQVVSPTNFWQVAPIQTLVQSTIPVTNSTNSATNARNLYVYSLATNIINVTNTITLPTNTSVFDGDEVTVIHRGGSNSVTAVRQLGSTNNLISLNSYDEAVKFIKDGNWDFYHNISFTEAIKFSGTNASVNVVTSRNTLQAASSTNYSSGVGAGAADRAQQLIGNDSGTIALIYDELGGDLWEVANPSEFRDAIGIPLAALTNTNNAKFQEAIFATNAAPTNAGNFGDYAAWMGVSIVTNDVTNVFRIPLYK